MCLLLLADSEDDLDLADTAELDLLDTADLDLTSDDLSSDGGSLDIDKLE